MAGFLPLSGSKPCDHVIAQAFLLLHSTRTSTLSALARFTLPMLLAYNRSGISAALVRMVSLLRRPPMLT